MPKAQIGVLMRGCSKRELYCSKPRGFVENLDGSYFYESFKNLSMLIQGTHNFYI